MPLGPGDHAAIFPNCDRLVLSIDGKRHSVLHPDRAGYPHIKYAPFFADLGMDGSKLPKLRIDGYIGDKLALSRFFSSDHTGDRLRMQVDDTRLQCDGSDATRLMFASVDKFGAPRPFTAGEVSIHLDGPGVIVGDNPFDIGASGGAGAVWIRSLPNRTGGIRISVSHPTLGGGSAEIDVQESRNRAEEMI